jgi:hypothetical protein
MKKLCGDLFRNKIDVADELDDDKDKLDPGAKSARELLEKNRTIADNLTNRDHHDTFR